MGKLEIFTMLTSLNFWLVSLGSALLTFATRQVVTKLFPASVESRVYNAFFPLVPLVVGVGLALIPGLRPSAVTSQSVVLGLVAGSFSGATYPFVKRMFALFLKKQEEQVK
jgi:hypothetical protein